MVPEEVPRVGGEKSQHERTQGEDDREGDAVDGGVSEQHALLRSLVGRWRVARSVWLSE